MASPSVGGAEIAMPIASSEISMDIRFFNNSYAIPPMKFFPFLFTKYMTTARTARMERSLFFFNDEKKIYQTLFRITGYIVTPRSGFSLNFNRNVSVFI